MGSYQLVHNGNRITSMCLACETTQYGSADEHLHVCTWVAWQLCCHKPGDLTWPQNCIGIGKAMYTFDPQLLHSYHTCIVVQQQACMPFLKLSSVLFSTLICIPQPQSSQCLCLASSKHKCEQVPDSAREHQTAAVSMSAQHCVIVSLRTFL